MALNTWRLGIIWKKTLYVAYHLAAPYHCFGPLQRYWLFIQGYCLYQQISNGSHEKIPQFGVLFLCISTYHKKSDFMCGVLFVSYTEAMTMGKLHKEIGQLIVQSAEDPDKSDSQVIKVNILFLNLINFYCQILAEGESRRKSVTENQSVSSTFCLFTNKHFYSSCRFLRTTYLVYIISWVTTLLKKVQKFCWL